MADLGKITKVEVWESIQTIKTKIGIYLDKNEKHGCTKPAREASKAAHKNALERWRAIPVNHTPHEPAHSSKTLEADGKAQSGDSVKQTLLWLKNKQCITIFWAFQFQSWDDFLLLVNVRQTAGYRQVASVFRARD
jgi:hypothetical protein